MILSLNLILFNTANTNDAIHAMYLPGKDKVVFADDQSVGARNDLRGMLLLDTALQTPVCRSEDQVKVEIPLAEVSLRKNTSLLKTLKISTITLQQYTDKF